METGDTSKVFYCAGMSCDVTGASFMDCLGYNRRPSDKAAMGLQVTAYILHVSMQFPQHKVADILKLSRASISKYIAYVENHRDIDRPFNDRLRSAERHVQATFLGEAALV